MTRNSLGCSLNILEDWKDGCHLLRGFAATSYKPNPDARSDTFNLDKYKLQMCTLVRLDKGSYTLKLANEVRAKWLGNPLKTEAWREDIKSFDATPWP